MSLGRAATSSARRSSTSEISPVTSSVVSGVSITATSGRATPSFTAKRATAQRTGSVSSPVTSRPRLSARSMPLSSTSRCDTRPSLTQACAEPSSEAIMPATERPLPRSLAAPPSTPLT